MGVLAPGFKISHLLTTLAAAWTGQNGEVGIAANIRLVKVRTPLVKRKRMLTYEASWAVVDGTSSLSEL